MRAVRSVINAAGLLKRAEPDMNEDQLLLRALRDVNVPKFLKDDIPLFENIISDLFPGVERPEYKYGNLIPQLNKSAKKFNYQVVDMFVQKILQLYDTIQVRHGLMIVGPTGGGKTANFRTLSHAITTLKGDGDFEKVHTWVLNPKSITMGQLYGEVDPQTTEWIDGVLAKLVSDCARDFSPDKHWIMFDGPVDAIWIENMNTVLDDNKKLCLNSGQIITLTDRMTMMFEVEDLSVASPATVSRCGMVYMEPGGMGLEPLIVSWFNTLPEEFKKSKTFHNNLKKLFDSYIHLMIKWFRKNLFEPVVTVNNNIVQSLTRILDCYFADYFETEIKKVSAEEVEELEQRLEQLFLFALVWSVGCTTNLEGRQKFDNKMRTVMKENGAKHPFPETGLVYDVMWHVDKAEWIGWMGTIP
jgi:dynein heavy chain